MNRQSSLSYIAPKVINAVLILGLLAFETFNMITTATALEQLVPVGLGIVLAIAFCATDIAGLVRVVTPAKTMKDEPKIVQLLLGVWLFVAMINMFLTWFSIQIYFDANPIRLPVLIQGIKDVIPIVLAAVVFLIHFTMVYSIGVYLEHNAAFQETVRPIGRALSPNVPNRPMNPQARGPIPAVGNRERSMFGTTTQAPPIPPAQGVLRPLAMPLGQNDQE